MLFEQYKSIAELEDPDFDAGWGGVHDWRNYVRDEIKENWGKLSLETRCVVIAQCQDIADKEEWD